MLHRLEFGDFMRFPARYADSVCTLLEDWKRLQRTSLLSLLEGPAADGSLASGDATVPIVDSALASWVSDEGSPMDVGPLMLVSKGWTAAVRLWLRKEAAEGFWRRFLAALFPAGIVRHPELASAVMLVEWLQMTMAVGSREDWLLCGRGRAESEEQGEAMTELELARDLSQAFALWCNVGEPHCPRPMGWMRLCIDPYLDGARHGTDGLADEARRTFDLQGGVRIPHSLAANICDCITDFCGCPRMSVPDHLNDFMHSVRRAIMRHVGLPSPTDHDAVYEGLPKQWRFLRVSAAQNERLFALLRRYAPLFPQRDDLAPRVPSEAVWKGRPGRRPPGQLLAPLLSSPFNEFMCIDKVSTDRDQELWDWYLPRPDLSTMPPHLAAAFAAIRGDDDDDDDDDDEEVEDKDEDEDEDEVEDEPHEAGNAIDALQVS
jgi:hypothetical protein